MARAPNDLRLRLVFSGECLPGRDPAVVRQAVAAALRLSSQRVERLFSGRPIVLKQQVDSAYAARQIARFAALGAVLRTEQHRPAAKPAQPRIPRWGADLAWRWPPDRSSPWLIGGLVLLVLVVGAWTLAGGHDEAASLGAGPAAARLSAPAPPAGPEQLVAPSVQLADEGLPRQLGAQAAQDYRQQYFPAAWHKAFVVAATGAHVWVVGAASPAQARAGALKRCAQTLQAAEGDCRVVDVDGEPQD